MESQYFETNAPQILALPEPIIRLNSVSKFYGDKQVLFDISMLVNRGEIIGYIGPNGAGKSTTVKILIGLITDYTGTAKVEDFEIKDHLLAVKQKVGFVPEVNELYDLLTPQEYLNLVGKLYKMEEAAIEERSLYYLKLFGIDSNYNERMDTFSKGMRQKVLLTAGFIHNPDIIILDEPLSGLDANAVIIVKNMMQDFKQAGKTILYCSHMMDVVEKVSDRIILIDKGRIIADSNMLGLRQYPDETLEHIFARLTQTYEASSTQ